MERGSRPGTILWPRCCRRRRSWRTPDISARRLLDGWKAPDDNTRMLAEVVASVFASRFSWAGSIDSKPLYCPPAGSNRAQVTAAFKELLAEHPDMAEKPYGDALAATLTGVFPFQGL